MSGLQNTVQNSSLHAGVRRFVLYNFWKDIPPLGQAHLANLKMGAWGAALKVSGNSTAHSSQEGVEPNLVILLGVARCVGCMKSCVFVLGCIDDTLWLQHQKPGGSSGVLIFPTWVSQAPMVAALMISTLCSISCLTSSMMLPPMHSNTKYDSLTCILHTHEISSCSMLDI